MVCVVVFGMVYCGQADMSKYTKIEKNGKTFYHIKAPFTAQ